MFGDFTPGIIYVSIMTGLILILAANTAFNGFPVLGSILAKDGYLPRQLHPAATGSRSPTGSSSSRPRPSP